MRKTVHVIRKSDNKVLSSVSMELRGLNYEPDEAEYFNQAFEMAVEDGDVKPEDRDKVRFEFQ